MYTQVCLHHLNRCHHHRRRFHYFQDLQLDVRIHHDRCWFDNILLQMVNPCWNHYYRCRCLIFLVPIELVPRAVRLWFTKKRTNEKWKRKKKLNIKNMDIEWAIKHKYAQKTHWPTQALIKSLESCTTFLWRLLRWECYGLTLADAKLLTDQHRDEKNKLQNWLSIWRRVFCVLFTIPALN